MKFSVSITTREKDVFYITLDSRNLPEELRRLLPSELEVIDVTLSRRAGQGFATVYTLGEISRIIADVFMDNKDAILYFFCDDMTPIPHTNKEILPQEYRSRLFSLLFERYIRENNIEDVGNYPVRINDVDGHPMIIHLFARDSHRQYVDIIKKDLMTNYSKPE